MEARVPKHVTVLGLLMGVVFAAEFAHAQTPSAPPTAARNDYAQPASWLCRPGRQDACAVDLTTSVVAASGAMTREAWTPHANPPIDCFYVYPTISSDPGVNSDMTADAPERNVIRQQFARFGSQCRLYAPLYRQVTLVGLRRAFAPNGDIAALLSVGLGYDDVLDAWNHYLQHDNQGRGVVLIGHSQGAYILSALIKREIEGKPVQARLVSAILGGTTVAVPTGKDVGGDFKTVPLCRAPNQIGCALVFATFRTTIPPPSATLFGKVTAPGMSAACTNPAALAGGSGDLRAYLTADGNLIVGTTPPPAWTTSGIVDAPWVSLPGLLSAECATNEHASYLAVTVKSNPADPRTDDIVGDLLGGGRPQANWGLHLIDMNLAMGNLLEIVGQQARTYTARR
jgi:hypothetical protein